MQHGDDVAALQKRLHDLGFDCGRIDGIFGPDTERGLPRAAAQPRDSPQTVSVGL